MDQITQAAKVVRGIVCLLVDYPDEVQVSTIKDGRGFVLEIKVAKSDIGKVIGKMGRTARALRIIFQAISVAQKIPIALDIVEHAPQHDGTDVHATYLCCFASSATCVSDTNASQMTAHRHRGLSMSG